MPAFRACSLILIQLSSNHTNLQEVTGKIPTAQNDQDRNKQVALHHWNTKYECQDKVNEAIHAHHAYLGVMEAGGSGRKGMGLNRITIPLMAFVMDCTVVKIFHIAKDREIPNSKYVSLQGFLSQR